MGTQSHWYRDGPMNHDDENLHQCNDQRHSAARLRIMDQEQQQEQQQQQKDRAHHKQRDPGHTSHLCGNNNNNNNNSGRVKRSRVGAAVLLHTHSS